MKFSKITFRTIGLAVKRQWKVFLAAVLVFAVLGAGAGFFYANGLSAPAEGSADELELLDVAELTYDKNYYNTVQAALAKAYTNANTCLSVLAAEVTATTEQKEAAEELQSRLQEFQEDTFDPIRETISKKNAVYIPAEFWDETVSDYEDLLERTKENLIIAENAAELLKEMQAPTFSTEKIADTYESILANASLYGTYQVNLQNYQEIVDNLSQNPGEIQRASRALEKDLYAAAEALNEIAEDVNAFAAEMAAENFLNISVIYNEQQTASISVAHTHTARSAQDSFLVMTLFCVLVGICCGAFLAICREAKKDDFAEESKDISSEVSCCEEAARQPE